MTRVKFRTDVTVELADAMGDETTIVHAARLSTLGAKSPEHEEQAGLLRFLAREGHRVPFEHCVLSFRLEVPIFVSRQIVKYRHTSISEESGRYRDLEPVFYWPDGDRMVRQVGKTGDYKFEYDGDLLDTAAHEIHQASLDAWSSYRAMLEAGVAKEVARTVLPVNLYSTMRVTGNLVHWLHFVGQRATAAPSHGQYEIALVADKIAAVLEERFPTVWGVFVENGYRL